MPSLSEAYQVLQGFAGVPSVSIVLAQLERLPKQSEANQLQSIVRIRATLRSIVNEQAAKQHVVGHISLTDAANLALDILAATSLIAQQPQQVNTVFTDSLTAQYHTANNTVIDNCLQNYVIRLNPYHDQSTQQAQVTATTSSFEANRDYALQQGYLTNAAIQQMPVEHLQWLCSDIGLQALADSTLTAADAISFRDSECLRVLLSSRGLELLQSDQLSVSQASQLSASELTAILAAGFMPMYSQQAFDWAQQEAHITPEQLQALDSFNLHYLLSNNGKHALTNGLITTQAILEIDNHHCAGILLGDNGLDALARGLITGADVNKLLLKLGDPIVSKQCLQHLLTTTTQAIIQQQNLTLADVIEHASISALLQTQQLITDIKSGGFQTKRDH